MNKFTSLKIKVTLTIIFCLFLAGHSFSQNNCASPVVIPATPLPYTQNGASTCNKVIDYPNICSNPNFKGRDYVYRFTPTSNICASIKVTNTTATGGCDCGQNGPCGTQCTDCQWGFCNACPCNSGVMPIPAKYVKLSAAILDGCPNAGGVCIKSQSVGGSNNVITLGGLQLIANQTYYIIVTDSTTCATFNLTLSQTTCQDPPYITPDPAATECYSNISFNSANFTNWTGYTGVCQTGPPNGTCYPMNQVTTAGLVPPVVVLNDSRGACGNNDNPGVRHTITTGASRDPNTDNVIPVVAPGQTFSARIGNQQNGLFLNPPMPEVVEAECIQYTFTVSPTSPLFTYLYAVIFEKPDHPAGDNPQFRTTVKDKNGAILPCGGVYTVEATSTALDEGYTQAANPSCKYNSQSAVLYKNWAAVSMDLTAYIGQPITVSFCTSDCALAGHYGYAYVDAFCKSKKINGTKICSGSNATLSAPQGFGNYVWYTGSTPTGTPIGTGQTTTIASPSTTTVFTVQFSSLRDANCKTTITDTIKVFSASASKDTTICQGAVGNYTLKGTSNDAATTYSWVASAGGFTSTSANPVIPFPTTTTTYSVTIKNSAYNCTVNQTVRITVNSKPTITSPGATICNGNTASITATGAGVSGTYSWNTGQSTQTITPNPTITTSYTVTGTNSNGCKNTSVATVTVNSKPNVTTNANAAVCVGQTSVNLTAAGASTYTWQPGGSTSNPLSVSPTANTTYSVTGTNGNGCTNKATVTITANNLPNIIASSSSSSICRGQTSASLSGSGGNTYQWIPGNMSGATVIVNPTSSTTYTLIGTNTTTGCTNQAPIMVTVNNIPIISSITKVDAACGQSDGSATANVSGGTPNYLYSWNTVPSQAAQTATGLSSGAYAVTITDTKGCTTNQSVGINNVSGPTLSVQSQSNVSCNSGNNGTATVSVSSGTPNYTYAWNTNPVQTTVTATGLTAGTWIATVRDGLSCISNVSVTISEPTVFLSSINASTTHVLCNGNKTGSASVNASGGTGNYTYLWSSVPLQNTAAATGLGAGTYSVTVNDANNCSALHTVTISQPAPLIIAATPTLSPVSCFAGNDASASINSSGGVINYTYSWSTNPVQTNNTASGLTVGAYTVVVTDANNCSVSTSVSITQPVAALTASVSSNTPTTCKGAGDGEAIVTGGQGTPGYTYVWSPGGQISKTATGLQGGQTYTVTVTDAKGCTQQDTITIRESNQLLTLNVNQNKPVTCKGANDGIITYSVTGGTTAYTYSWSHNPSLNSNTATGLGAGTYTVTVTDAYGCIKNDTVRMLESTQQFTIASIILSPVTCTGSKDGSILVTSIGGTQAYRYQWFPSGPNDPLSTGLPGGTYTVTVTDAYGCSRTDTATIAESPTLLTGTLTAVTPVSCKGSSDGSATEIAGGGTPPYNYQWLPTSPLQTGATATGLSAGTYTVNISDKHNCQIQNVVVIPESGVPLTITSVTTTPVTCTGASDGRADISILGGTPAYTYFWSPNNNTIGPLATGLAGGTYTVTVRDSYGCSKTTTAIVNESATAFNFASTSSIPVTCKGASDGSISVTATGGTTAYTYSWNPSVSTGNNATALAGGTYTITATDLYGCIRTTTAKVDESVILLTPDYTSTLAACDKDNGTVSVSVMGGTGPFTYLWNPNVSTGNSASGLAKGIYSISVTDSFGCTKTITATVNQPSKVTASFIFSPASGLAPLSVTFTNGSTGGGGYQWHYGDTLISVIQDTIFNPKHLYKDSGTYVVRLITFNQWGCADTIYATIRVNMKSIFCVPNVFSPNGDGKNDVWKLCQPGIEYLEVDIYDRWGLLIYQWDTPAGGWDGRSTTGKEVPEGTYYYIIKAQGTDKVDYGTTGGYLMLLRK